MNELKYRRVRPPYFLTTFVLVATIDLALRFLGFARSVALVRRFARSRQVIHTTRADIQAICQRVITVAVFHPGRAECLEQSLALFVLLRRRGIAAELKLGVQPYPFNAHAWVELNGSPLNESAERVRHFVPLQDFAL